MAGGFPLVFGRTVLARVMRRLSGGSARDRFARQPSPRGRWFLRFVEEPRAMSTGTEMSRFGVVPEKGAERRGRIAGQIARAGHPATAGR